MNRHIFQRCVPVCSCAILLSALAGAQTTWYVDVHGTPPGHGTPADPYTSIQYAMDSPTTSTGHTVLVAPGTYYENLHIVKAITVRGSAGPLATILRPPNGGDGVEIYGPNVNATILDGFTVQVDLGWTGMYIPTGTARNCIVRDCVALAGIECGDCNIESCTIVRNRMGVIGAFTLTSIVIRNSIVWGNTYENVNPGNSYLNATFDAGFGTPGGGNIPGDPGLWSLAIGDLRLRPGSPCIDAGDPNAPPDPDGSRHDIGALAYEPTYAPAPTAYCTAKLNSQGCTPAIGAIGSASATSSAPFSITAAYEVPNKSGLLFFGFGPRAQPFQGGVHCIQLPTKRVGVQTSGGSAACTGAFAFDMGGYIQSGVHPGLVPGALVYCQWWSRDPLDPAGFGTGLSDALWFGVAP